MIAWWQGMTFLEQIFAMVAIPSTIILFIQTALSVFAFGGDSELLDSTVDGESTLDSAESFSEAGLKMFTIRGFVAFFSVFGWSGLVMLKSNLSSGVAVLLAVIFGFISMALVALAFYLFMRLQSSGTINIQSAIAATGTAYLPIPAKRAGRGKVTALVSGRLTEFDAVTDEDKGIPTGTPVTVVSITGENTLVVISK